jgi:hypothetical protein
MISWLGPTQLSIAVWRLPFESPPCSPYIPFQNSPFLPKAASDFSLDDYDVIS